MLRSISIVAAVLLLPMNESPAPASPVTVDPSGPRVVFDPASPSLAPIERRTPGMPGSPQVVSEAEPEEGTWEMLDPGVFPPSHDYYPPGRQGAAGLYDVRRDRMLIYGGGSSYDGCFAIPWGLLLSPVVRWQPLPQGSPCPYGDMLHTMVYDSRRDRLIQFGGEYGSLGNLYLFNDVWVLPLSGGSRWSKLEVVGDKPLPRFWHCAAYDPARDRMLVYGGAPGHSGVLDDLWLLTFSPTPTWTQVTPTDPWPGGRIGASAVLDPAGDRMIVFGGVGEGSERSTWALSLTDLTWSEMATSGPMPHKRYGHAAVLDSLRNRMIVYGGSDRRAAEFADVWTLSLSDPPTWSERVTSGPGPGPRHTFVAAYDTRRDRLMLYGGFGDGHEHTDTWVLPSEPPVSLDVTLPGTLNLRSMGRWVTAYLQPPAGFEASAIDVGSIRLQGAGAGAPAVAVDEGAPSAIDDQNGDSVPDLMVKFDRTEVGLALEEGPAVPVMVTGRVGSQRFTGTTTLKILRVPVTSPAAASVLGAGALTTVRWETAAGMDVESVAMLWSIDNGAAWTLEATGLPNSGHCDWTVPQAVTPQGRVAIVLVESSDATGYVVHGALGVSDPFQITGQVAVGDAAEVAFALRGVLPNPATGGAFSVALSLPSPEPATLELLDIHGRRFASETITASSPGARSIALGTGTKLPAGVYVIRLSQAGRWTSRKAVVLP